MSTEETETTPNTHTELVERLQIENTPFQAVRIDEKWFLTCGKYRVSEPVATFEECEQDARTITWNRLVTVMQVLIENQPKLN